MTRVLIFEDDSSIREFLKDLLEMHHYEVKTFEHPGIIAKSLRWENSKNGNDIILTDFNMPEMDGIDLISHLLNIGIHKKYIGIMSGTWTAESKKFVQENEIYYFEKPFQFNEILNWLNGLKNETNGVRLISEYL